MMALLVAEENQFIQSFSSAGAANHAGSFAQPG
jgi:hypothetical protein